MLTVLLCLGALAGPWEEVASTAEMSVDDAKLMLKGVEKRQSVLDRMASPWERKPWYQFEKIFSDQKRVDAGLDFWRANEATLTRVQSETGIPAEIIIAIIGVETRYGSVMGNDPVVEALYTLGFFHERRGSFFRKELGHFLRISADEQWDLIGTQGSYAGAMGMGQFMPSSYRTWAVDGDGDGKRDLFGSSDDAIASVANYFVAHGWKRGQGVLLQPTAVPSEPGALVRSGLKLEESWDELAKAGVEVDEAVAGDAPARLFGFDLADGKQYRVGLHNFYVITRYNHSHLYARSVYDLSQRLVAARSSADPR